MTLLHPPRSSATSSSTEADVRRRLATRRPLVPTATLGGAIAAAGPLLVLLAVGVVGWFLTDAGTHGSPSGALRVGASGWLLAHGSGITIEGVRITAVPLGLTLLAAWSVWRVGHRVGESIADHGPDAGRIQDGERDWTVPTAALLFVTGYVLVTVLTATLTSTAATVPSTPRAVGWSLLLTTLVGLPAIAAGSGRAAVWVTLLPPSVRAAAAVCRSLLVTWLVFATLAWVVALVADFATAANIVSQLDTGAGDAALVSALSLTAAPNATLWSSAYLLGPGFTLGTGTVVGPAAVVLGPLPLFPLLAALPAAGLGDTVAVLVMGTPAVVAALAAARAHRRLPAVTWDRAAVRGGVGGILAGFLLGWLTSLSGGAVGPGRLQAVGPFSAEVLLHAVAALGIGGLVGALGAWWWTEHGARIPGLGRLRAARRTP
ncbi:hypothetical protein KUV85_09275 [Nocardioides panacisoli]|uniref:cell division protein PerM n=1 Tax=Nocardioides panacisoli TaxID=627624 RepID=UPI001C629CA3|nr:DUF6350 family protein [Nocardioides panacisoli]QYJ02531.1 hypothetical protein KUV85_09275 [Nocardioides panacisoli]